MDNTKVKINFKYPRPNSEIIYGMSLCIVHIFIGYVGSDIFMFTISGFRLSIVVSIILQATFRLFAVLFFKRVTFTPEFEIFYRNKEGKIKYGALIKSFLAFLSLLMPSRSSRNISFQKAPFKILNTER